MTERQEDSDECCRGSQREVRATKGQKTYRKLISCSGLYLRRGVSNCGVHSLSRAPDCTQNSCSPSIHPLHSTSTGAFISRTAIMLYPSPRSQLQDLKTLPLSSALLHHQQQHPPWTHWANNGLMLSQISYQVDLGTLTLITACFENTCMTLWVPVAVLHLPKIQVLSGSPARHVSLLPAQCRSFPLPPFSPANFDFDRPRCSGPMTAW
ncbi:hypothetical protein B0H34DRAFT_252512 [Crassisporium funariophilum]|nr:hypothetical protein B0H34DRAFT_252512 [Crassisporium funariophilum]